jgi:hypothetical protein
MKFLYLPLSLFALFALAFTATATGATALSPDDGTLLDLARPVFDAVMHGQYWLGASLALVLAVAAFKRYAPAGALQDFAHSNAGASLLVLLGSFGGALATALLAVGSNGITLALAWTALKVALVAAGGYTLLKNVIVDPLMASSWYQTSAPEWLKSIMMLLLWVFLKPSPVVAAADAGNTAVNENPPTGADGSTGTPTDL